MPSLSIYMITLDEEKRLPRTLNAIRNLADEIIIVDSGSKDKTMEIARSFGAKIFQREWDNYSSQKAYAESLTSGDWLMNLDADEEVSRELAVEIRNTIEKGKNDVYRVKIADVFPGQARPHPLVKCYNVFRLYRRNCAKMGQTNNWDRIGFCNDNVRKGQLKGRIFHHSFISLDHTLRKYNSYTDEQLKGAQETGRKYPPFRLLLAMNLNFLKYFFLYRQFLYGWWGYINAVNQSYLRFLKFAKFYESQCDNEGEDMSRGRQ